MKNNILASRRVFALTFATLIIGQVSHAQSILGSAGEFTLLGGTAITSSGVAGTVISNGDVGLSPGATSGITGFPPAVISNGEIIETGAVTAQARSDLIKASTALALMPSDVDMSGLDLGHLTLTPGVYTFSSAAALTGPLTLDAQGLNTAFWVFQIGTALTTAANSTVSLINPGSNMECGDVGVFWNAGSEIIIGADNVTMGNYLSGTSITWGNGSGGGSRALALAAITLDNNQIDAFGTHECDLSGGLTFNEFGEVVPVPEPAAVVMWLLPIGALCLMLKSRFHNRKDKGHVS